MLEVIHALNSHVAAQATNLFVCLPSICIYILIILVFVDKSTHDDYVSTQFIKLYVVNRSFTQSIN